MNVGMPDAAKRARHAFLEAGGDVRPGWIPEKSASEWAITALLFVASVLYLRLFYNYTLLNPDEGVSLMGAQRILNGEVPYRDFFTFFTPGSFYWMALLFKVFGNSILVARAALMVYGGVFSALTYLLARRVCSRWVAFFTVYLLTLTCLPYRFIVLHNWDSTLWAYLALYFSVRLLEEPHWGHGLAAGTFASLTCLFEQSKGGGLVLGLALGFGIILALGGEHKFKLPHLWAVGAGFGLPILITVCYFASQHSLPQMLADWTWPLSHYSLANTTPYGYLELSDSDLRGMFAGSWPSRLFILFILSPCFLITALPILAVGFLCYWLIRSRRIKESQTISSYYVLVSATLVGLLLSTLATGRADLHHILYQVPMFILVLGWSLEDSCIRSQLWGTLRPLFTVYLFLSFTVLGLALLWPPLNAHVILKTRRGVLKADKADSVLEELQSRVQPGQKIFVYPYQPMYYYLSATFNATGYEFLFPGMNTPEQFEQAFREVGSARPVVVVFLPSFPDLVPLYWPATPANVFSGHDQGVEYLLARYRPCKTLTSLQTWHFVFMVRKDLSCAGPI